MNKLDVWETKDYIDKAHKGSMDMKHPAMQMLLELSKKADKIVDLGCGEGTRINEIVYNQYATGVDISKNSIERAKEKFPHINFIQGDLTNLSIKDSKYDLVFSAYVLEHLDHPKKMLDEAIRILKKNGKLLLVAPNYGAPNRSSPPFRGSRTKKILIGILKDIKELFIKGYDLDWVSVSPITDKKYEMDYDTLTEPYVRTLVNYLKMNKLKIVKESSLWSEELSNAKFHQLIFRKLGSAGVYPFKYWGPHLFIVAEKI